MITMKRQRALRNAAALAAALCALPVWGQTAAPPALPAGATTTLQLAWKIAADPGAQRVAVADTVGDGNQRVVLLCKPASGPMKVLVTRWQKDAFTTEWTGDLPETTATFGVGRFDPASKGAQIVTSRCWFGWESGKYVRHDLPKQVVPAGTLQRKDGSAVLLARDQNSFAAYTLDTRSAAAPLVRKEELPDDGEFYFGRMYAPAQDLETQMPPDFAICGYFGFWDVLASGRPARLVAQYISRGQYAGTYAVLAPAVGQKAVYPSWRSPALEGRFADMCHGAPKGDGVLGLVVLTASADGKSRALTLFAPVQVPPAR